MELLSGNEKQCKIRTECIVFVNCIHVLGYHGDKVKFFHGGMVSILLVVLVAVALGEKSVILFHNYYFLKSV